MRVLVTTALEQSWPTEDPVLFLGEWCRRYSRKDKWGQLDAKVVPYHWDDRRRFEEDYERLASTYERLLADFAEALNHRHGVDRSLRYWRIVIGPWLGFFTHMAWDRWRMLEEAACRSDVASTIVLDGVGEGLIPKDMVDFNYLYLTEEWNHWLFRQILQTHNQIPLVPVAYDSEEGLSGPPERPAIPTSLKVSLLRRWSHFVSQFSRRSDVVIVSPYMTWASELSLHWRLGQVPLVWSMVNQPVGSFEAESRVWEVVGKPVDDFETFVLQTASKQIPVAYLEGYGHLSELATEARWPSDTPVVFTSNSHYADDFFKVWVADRVEKGSRLAVGQHGGNFGVSRKLFVEDHEVAIADRYLSWGWSDQSRPKIHPVGQLINWPKSAADHGANERILVVATSVPRQSYHLFSETISSQWLSYLEDQFDFVDALPSNLREALLIRLYQHDYGWDQQERWIDRHPDVDLEPGVVPIQELIEQCRVYVATYNATTFLETFAMDVPTIMFWNPDHWELRESALEAFEGLVESGVLHYTPESAAGHLASIWSDVPGWWADSTVRKAVGSFNEALNWTRDDVVDAVAHELAELVGEDPPRWSRQHLRIPFAGWRDR